VDTKDNDAREQRRQEWKTYQRQWWMLADGKLKTAQENTKQEVHLPSQIKGIVKQVFDRRSEGYNQTMYLFKTHGSRLLVKDKGNGEYEYPKPDLRALTLGKQATDSLTADSKPIF